MVGIEWLLQIVNYWAQILELSDHIISLLMLVLDLNVNALEKSKLLLLPQETTHDSPNTSHNIPNSF